ncbi:MAG: DUF2934 domain-containing protein [Geminicoccaceae bacterium]
MEQNRIDRIRARARALWEARGRPQGQALDDWLAAEREIDGPTLADAGEEDPLAGVDEEPPGTFAPLADRRS